MKRLKKPHMEPQEIHCLCKTFLIEEKEKKKKINTVISLFADSLALQGSLQGSQPAKVFRQDIQENRIFLLT